MQPPHPQIPHLQSYSSVSSQIIRVSFHLILFRIIVEVKIYKCVILGQNLTGIAALVLGHVPMHLHSQARLACSGKFQNYRCELNG